MRRLNTRNAIWFVDATTAPPESCTINRLALLTRFHGKENGRLLSGAAAFAAMWRAIPLLRPLGFAARSPTVLRLLEGADRDFLIVRSTLQCAVRRVSAA